MVDGYDIDSSLKQGTRNSLDGDAAIACHITDQTITSNMSVKKLPSCTVVSSIYQNYPHNIVIFREFVTNVQ